MGFLHTTKATISKATERAKDKIDDVKDRRRADDLLEELGRIMYRQRTNRGSPVDDDDVVRLVAELQALEAGGTPPLGKPNGGRPGPPSDGPSGGPVPA